MPSERREMVEKGKRIEIVEEPHDSEDHEYQQMR
jgi:hypothetical protein